MTKQLTAGWEAAQAQVTEALKTEGFGVLTRIDVQATFKEKLGVDFRRYLILGACNPSFAHRALSQDAAAGLMMPCNVTLHEGDDGTVTVQVVDPLQTMATLMSTEFKTLAEAVREKLVRVLERL